VDSLVPSQHRKRRREGEFVEQQKEEELIFVFNRFCRGTQFACG
jgi:hypothetical protein